MQMSVDAVIARLGGAEAGARLLGVGTEAVRKWRQQRVIPSRHWPALIAATGLSLAELPGAGAGRRAVATMPRPRAPRPRWCWPTERCSGAAALARTVMAARWERCASAPA